MRSLLAALTLGLSLLLLEGIEPTTAHDLWISHQSMRNAAGEWCCGQGDCGIIDKSAVKLTFGGYRVDGFVTIKGTAESGNVREEVHETVPFGEAQPSPDGQFWRCKRPDGTRRCFFAPPESW